MPYRGLTWKFKFFLMVCAFFISLGLLYVKYIDHGYLPRYAVMAALVSFIFVCLLLVLCDRSWRKYYMKEEEQSMELNVKCQIDDVSQNPPKRPHNKITFRKILMVCGIAICMISSVFSVFRDSADEHNKRGLTHYKAGKTEIAISEFTKAIERNPKSAKAYYNRGSVYELINDNNKAIADLNMAVKLKPTLAGAYFNRGKAYFKLGEREIAIRDFTRAIRINPEHASSYASRGSVYALKGENEKAIADCTRAIELDLGLAEAYHTRGQAYFSQKQFSKAHSDLKKAQSLGHKVNPDFMWIVNTMLEKQPIGPLNELKQ